jgi:excisionase family DNA binding protein
MTLAEQTLQEYEKAEPALLLSAAKTAKLLGVGRTALYALNSSGRLPLPVRLGGRVLWRRAELEEWVSSEPPCPNREKWELIKRNKDGEK